MMRRISEVQIVVDKEAVKASEAINEARRLHDELLHHGIPACQIPAAIFTLREHYHQALRHDHKHFKKHELSEAYIDAAQVKTMRILLNKFVHYSLSEDDVKSLQSVTFAEADHMREFLRFEVEAAAYARFISEYLIKLHDEINKHYKKVGAETVVSYPRFYKGTTAPDTVDRLNKILKDIHKDLVPESLFIKFDKVFKVFENIKPSKARTPERQAFYDEQLEKLRGFSFIPMKQVHQKVDDQEDDVEVIFSRNLI